MIYIISPAKTIRGELTNTSENKPKYFDNAIEINQIVSKINDETLSKKFKVSDSKLIEIKSNILNFDKEYIQAIRGYDGLVYKQIDKNFSKDDINFSSDHFVIIDAMYGIIRPFDSISKYRMDFTVKFDNFNPIKYWKEKINRYLEGEDKIISLASNEFYNIIDHKNKTQVIFLQNKNGIKKSYSTETKIARGMFINHIIKNKIKDITQINELDGYKLTEVTSEKITYIKE